MLLKRDLTEDMVIELRDGRKYKVKDDLAVNKEGFINLNFYNDDLSFKGKTEYDVVKVYRAIPIEDPKVFEGYKLELIEDITYRVNWEIVPVDTKILVSSDGVDWKRRYFAKYEDGTVFSYSHGCTSWTTENYVAWDYAKLVEELNI